jgi:hypothetical protein
MMKFQGIFKSTKQSGFGRLVILAYERIGAGPPSVSEKSGPPVDCIDHGEFCWQMEQVARRFKAIPLSHVMWNLGGKRPLMGPQICVSFHTDARDDIRSALPIMQRMNIPATLFVAFERILEVDPIDVPNAAPGLDWAAVRAIAAGGMEIAHRFRADSAWPALHTTQRRSRLTELRGRAERETGVRVHSFAIEGEMRGEPDKALIYDAAIAGFSLCVVGRRGTNTLRPISPMMLERQAITHEVTRAQFQSLLDDLERDP